MRRFRRKIMFLVVGFYAALFVSSTFVLLFEFVIPHGGSRIPNPIIIPIDDILDDLEYPGEVPTLLGNSTIIGSYTTDMALITIYQTRLYNSDVFIADVVLRDAQSMISAFSYDIFGGKNYRQTISAMAKENDAIFGINADNASHFNFGYIIRNGYVLRSTPSDRDAVALNYDGTLVSYVEEDISIQAIMDNGAWQLWSFGPSLIVDGVSVASFDGALERETILNPRTAIGSSGSNHFMFVVVDGRSDISAGVDIIQLANIMKSLNCTTAYNFDGGSSSTMWFDGEVINNPSNGSERKLGDSVFISK